MARLLTPVSGGGLAPAQLPPAELLSMDGASVGTGVASNDNHQPPPHPPAMYGQRAAGPGDVKPTIIVPANIMHSRREFNLLYTSHPISTTAPVRSDRRCPPLHRCAATLRWHSRCHRSRLAAAMRKQPCGRSHSHLPDRNALRVPGSNSRMHDKHALRLPSGPGAHWMQQHTGGSAALRCGLRGPMLSRAPSSPVMICGNAGRSE